MKLFSSLLLAGIVLTMASCEITREITLNQDGSGKLSNTIDMSSVIGMAKMAGQGKDMEKLEKQQIDTTISLEKIVDSIEGLSAEEKTLAKKGTLDFKMNMEQEKFVARTQFPFSDPSQLQKLATVSQKAVQQAMKKQMAAGGENAPPGLADNQFPEGSVDDYYAMTYTKNSIEKKLLADKYAKVGEDKGVQALKEIAGQGLPITTTVIINLPRPAKKTTGKNITLSDDKKKVTISEPMDDFFDDGKNFEYKIEF